MRRMSQKYCSPATPRSCQAHGNNIAHRSKMCRRLQFATHPGLKEVTTKSFRVLGEGEDDEDDEEMRYVRDVDSWVCGAGANWTADKKTWACLEDSVADESCCLLNQ